MNIVILSGNNVRELKVNKSGKMCFGTLAVQSSSKDEDGNFKTIFMPFRILGEKSVETATKFFTKGKKFEITGEVFYEDVKQDDGSYKTYCYVIVKKWEFGENKAKDDQASKEEPAKDDSGDDNFWDVPEGTEGDLPFD